MPAALDDGLLVGPDCAAPAGLPNDAPPILSEDAAAAPDLGTGSDAGITGFDTPWAADGAAGCSIPLGFTRSKMLCRIYRIAMTIATGFNDKSVYIGSMSSQLGANCQCKSAVTSFHLTFTDCHASASRVLDMAMRLGCGAVAICISGAASLSWYVTCVAEAFLAIAFSGTASPSRLTSCTGVG